MLVDEYQDTNVLAEILQRLKPSGEGDRGGRRRAGDLSFRAATIENIRGFQKQFNSSIVPLEENYRSTQQILDAANALIGKNLYSKKKLGAKPRYGPADDEGQAQYVVTRVLEARERGVLLRNQAVLFRASHHSDMLELELVRRNIPYVKYGGLKFLEAAHVKDLLAVLRWADNPRNRVAALPSTAAPARGRARGRGAGLHSFRGRGLLVEVIEDPLSRNGRADARRSPMHRGRGRCSACASGISRTSSASTTPRR